LKSIKKQLVEKNKKLNEATENGIWLKDNYGQHEARNAAVDRQLENAENEMDKLKEKLAEKNAQLELILYKKQSYELSMDKFMAWCVSVDKIMRSQDAVSLRYPEIIIQQREIEVNKFGRNGVYK
jgi:septal ring factor EnvC (AmiA/AmiB activator)